MTSVQGGKTNGRKAAAQWGMDFTKETAPALVTDGAHAVTITEALPGQAASGNYTIKLTYTVDDSHDEQNVGRKVFDVLTLTERAFFRVVQLVRACGDDCIAAMQEFQGVTPTPDVAKGMAEVLLGESIVISTAQQESSGMNPQTGAAYPPQARVVAYMPFGTAISIEDTRGEESQDITDTAVDISDYVPTHPVTQVGRGGSVGGGKRAAAAIERPTPRPAPTRRAAPKADEGGSSDLEDDLPF